jgi:hypothetical protein
MKNISQDKRLLQQIFKEKTERKKVEAIGNRDLEPNLKVISDALDNYYFVNKLRLYCAFLSYKNIIKPEKIGYNSEDLLLIKEIIKCVESAQVSHPTLEIYNHIRKLFESIFQASDQMNELFDITVSLITKNEKTHSSEENLEMYSLLNNYCIRRMNEGKKEYKSKFLWLNNQIINLRYRGVHQKQITMQPSLFRNIVVVALSINDPQFFTSLNTCGLTPDGQIGTFKNASEWVEKFIKFYGHKIGNSNQAKSYYLYCNAILEFSRKNFAKAYKIFNNSMRVQGTFLNLDIKILHLKILYEVNIRKAAILEYDKIEIRKVLDAYRKLVSYEESKKRQLSYQISFYSTFEKNYNKLFRLYLKYSGRAGNLRNEQFIQKKEELTELISSKTYHYNDWFLEKLNTIK